MLCPETRSNGLRCRMGPQVWGGTLWQTTPPFLWIGPALLRDPSLSALLQRGLTQTAGPTPEGDMETSGPAEDGSAELAPPFPIHWK